MAILETGALVAVLAAVMSAFWWHDRSRRNAPELGHISQQWLVQHRAHEREPRP